MPGLLGDGFEDPRSSAIMALSGGLLRGDFGGGLLGADQAFNATKANALKQRLTDMQMQNYASEIEARKLKAIQDQRQQRLMESFFPGLSGGGSGTTATPGPAPAGLPTAGSRPAPAPGGGNGILELAQRYGIPPEAIQADIVFNGGKKIAELLDKHGSPDMQVTNGFAYDKNRVGAGYLPQLNTSRDGKTSMVQIRPDGMPVVSAPEGAYNTFAGYQNLEEGTKARFDPVQVVGPDGAARFVPRSQVVAPQGRGVSMGAEADRFAILSQELAKAKAAGRAGDVAALEREISRLPPGARTATNPSGLSVPGFQATPTTEQAVEKARLLKQTEADVRPTDQRKNDIAGSNYMLSVLDRAINHPGRETATGLSGTLDPRNYFPGTDATGFKAFLDQIRGGTFMQAYQNLKGGGQITEVEGKKAENAIARLNTAQSDDDFLSALTDLRSVIQSGLTRQMAGAQTGGATGSFAGDNSDMVNKSNLVQSLPKTAAKGTRARDTITGKMLVFNGISWVPEK